MIRRKTTLILGAGSAMPYGFPSGATLRHLIAHALANSPQIQGPLNALGHSKRQILEFSNAFRVSNRESIDDFLSKRPQFGPIGKHTIGAFLIEKEDPKALTRSPIGDNWYSYLWNRIGDSWEAFEENELRIVTFNYDRSLEHFLAMSLAQTFDKSESDALGKLAHLQIVHVYGDIGGLGPMDVLSGTRPYAVDLSPDALTVAASRIHVIDERTDDSPEFELAREHIAWAQQICFLGFGFDATNMRRLGLYRKGQSTHGKRVHGTAVGMRRAEVETIADYFTGLPADFPSKESREFLRETGALLAE